MVRRAEKISSLAALALYTLLLALVLALAVVGGRLYGQLSQSRAANNAARASLSYVSARLRACDEADAVQVVPGPKGDALVLAELQAGTGYETRIYWYDGALMEEYAPTGSEFDPQNAQPVAKTAAFAVVQEGGTLTVITGEGEVRVTLHTPQEAAS